MGRFAKFMPTGYEVPGIFRRLSPKYGSGKIPSATCAASTVLGTVALIHPCVENPAPEILSPAAFTLHADCNRQPSCRGVTVAARSMGANIAEASRHETR